MNVLDVIGQIFWFGILATPLLSFFIIRKMDMGLIGKILLGTGITIVFAFVMAIISTAIVVRNGLGPT